MTRLQERYDLFAARFLRPLVGLGEVDQVHLGQALHPSLLEYFTHARPSDSEVEAAIMEGLYAGAASIARFDRTPDLGRGGNAIAMAAHNLLLATDPKLRGFPSSRSRRSIIDWTESLIQEAGAPELREDALVRHALVDRVVSIAREDVVVKNWAYTYRYYGRPVPERVTAMPKLRAVKTRKTARGLDELLVEENWDARLDDNTDLRGPYEQLTMRSPITTLVRFDVLGQPRLGLAELAALSDPGIRHGIAVQLVARGPAFEVARVYGNALRDLVDAGPGGELLEPLVALLLEIQFLYALDRRAKADSDIGLEARSSDEISGVQLFAALLLVFAAGHGDHPWYPIEEAHRRAISDRARRTAPLLSPAVKEEAGRILSAALPKGRVAQSGFPGSAGSSYPHTNSTMVAAPRFGAKKA